MNIAQKLIRLPTLVCLIGIAMLSPGQVAAEQKQQLGPFEAHYVVVNTMFFNEEVAAQYGVVRGRDRALVNVSFLDESGSPVAVTLFAS